MPRKLGQHFLNSPQIIEKTMKSSDLNSDDVVLEIGPGEGVLTTALSKIVKKVITIEIDEKLLPNLKERFKNKENVEIIHDDILKINLPNLLKANKITNYKLIANIPYYITSKILRVFLETKNPPKEMILMVQKEVAERIISGPGKMSKLSVSVQYYGEAEYLFTVGKENFNPPPKVDSAVIRVSQIVKHKANRKTKEDDKKFFKIVRAGFCARRKTLINNISSSLHLDKKSVEEKLKTADISSTVRAQELSIEKWKELSNLF